MYQEIQKLTEKVNRLQSLIQVTAIISSVLDLEILLKLVMDKAQSVMKAEASSILLLNEDTGMLECEIALGEVGDKVKQKVRLEMGQGIGGWVAQTGKPLIVADVNSDSRFHSESDQETGFHTRSILAVPLKVKDKIIGVAEVLNPLDSRAFTEDDLDLFETFSRQVALAIENARMHQHLMEKQKLEQQLEAAYFIQQSFMPQSFPQSVEGQYSVWARNLPAKSIGGDFYDFIEFPDKNRLGVIIGDVSGKGIPAALYMARLVSDFRFFSLSENDISVCLERVNNSLVNRSRRGMFVTVSYLMLEANSGKVTFANAGHLPLIWYHYTEKKAEFVSGTDGVPLGILKDANFEACEIQLSPGDYLILFTDGVIEAKNKTGIQFSLQRVLDCLTDCWESPRELVEHILKEVVRFSKSAPQHDDITVVSFRWH